MVVMVKNGIRKHIMVEDEGKLYNIINRWEKIGEEGNKVWFSNGLIKVVADKKLVEKYKKHKEKYKIIITDIEEYTHSTYTYYIGYKKDVLKAYLKLIGKLTMEGWRIKEYDTYDNEFITLEV